MQQDWESVEVGGWEDGDSFVEREEGREEGGKERVNRGVLECKLEKDEVLRRDTTLLDQKETRRGDQYALKTFQY